MDSTSYWLSLRTDLSLLVVEEDEIALQRGQSTIFAAGVLLARHSPVRAWDMALTAFGNNRDAVFAPASIGGAITSLT